MKTRKVKATFEILSMILKEKFCIVVKEDLS